MWTRSTSICCSHCCSHSCLLVCGHSSYPLTFHTPNHIGTPYSPLPECCRCNQSQKARSRGETGDDKRGRIPLPGPVGENARRLSDRGHVDPIPAGCPCHRGNHRRRRPRRSCHGSRFTRICRPTLILKVGHLFSASPTWRPPNSYIDIPTTHRFLDPKLGDGAILDL
jgi:hypothetical protein